MLLMEETSLPYHCLKLSIISLNTIYALLQVIQIIFTSIYIFYCFGPLYKTTGIIINCLLCLFRSLSPITAFYICSSSNGEDIMKRQRSHWLLLGTTITLIIGGCIAYLVLHGFIASETDGDSFSAVIVLVSVVVDSALYISVWLCTYKLSSSMSLSFGAELKTSSNE